MIKRIKESVVKYMHSLRIGMLAVIVVAILLAAIVYAVLHAIMLNWVADVYNSHESRHERYEEYLGDLKDYVRENEISSDDTAAITRWVRSNRNVYVFLYKDDQLFYDGTVVPDEDKGDTDKEETPGTDSTTGETDEGEGTNEERPSGGVTVDYPTREEIIESAGKNGLLPIDFKDGTLFVSLVDFTEYIYYDIANITSIIAAFATLALILMLYFQRIIFRISNLASDVRRVYEVDMNTGIRTAAGNDELSVLTRGVERMRSTMLDSLEKEKEAINANAELITSISHDIRTPLTVLLGYIDIMKSRPSDEVMAEYLRASESTALRLKELSDDMFRYFLVFGGGAIEPELANYGARTLVEQLLTEHILLLGERGYNVSYHPANSLKDGVRVSTDAPKLMRVIDNLFSNIYKYADPDGNITVAAGVAHGGRVEIAIKNLIKENNDGAESSGIGLKTCKKLCDALGVQFEHKISGARGKRAFTAILTLPRATDALSDGEA